MIYKLYNQLYRPVHDVLAKMKRVKAAVIGDFCLDAYWQLANTHEISLETGLPVQRIESQRYSPGGAGNVVVNLHALGVQNISIFGIIGDDLFGRALKGLLSGQGADTSGLLTQHDHWQTYVYAKPIQNGQELNRIDFGGFNHPTNDTLSAMVKLIEKAAEEHDVLLINQQIQNGLYQQPVIDAINRVARRFPDLPILVDSRHYAEKFERVIIKANIREAVRIVAGAQDDSRLENRQVAEQLFARTQRPVFITQSERGMLIAQQSGVHEIPGVYVPPPIDSVGAGDTAMATIAATLGSDCSPEGVLTAGWLANLAASIVLKKLQTTGVATPAEIELAAAEADYIYEPELAADPRRAAFVPGADIEIVRQFHGQLAIKHAIFDHDGTISTLREGWESIMEPMMVQAILGSSFASASMDVLREVSQAAKEFIDRTTGIQTLVQMKGLVDLIRSFGYVPENEILDEHGYKRLYNDQLLKMVHQRVARLEKGELSPHDFQLKNAHQLLQKLHKAGVTLYLASGTDVQDVISEACALGYADLFGNRIFGAVGDVAIEAKRMVLERIIRENRLSGSQFVTFGDGPVEMRETRKRGGVAVGVASDEARRFGINPSKRKRLITAGANLIVADYGQLDQLLYLLQVNSK